MVKQNHIELTTEWMQSMLNKAKTLTDSLKCYIDRRDNLSVFEWQARPFFELYRAYRGTLMIARLYPKVFQTGCGMNTEAS